MRDAAAAASLARPRGSKPKKDPRDRMIVSASRSTAANVPFLPALQRDELPPAPPVVRGSMLEVRYLASYPSPSYVSRCSVTSDFFAGDDRGSTCRAGATAMRSPVLPVSAGLRRTPADPDWPIPSTDEATRARGPRNRRARNPLDSAGDVVCRASHDLGGRAVEVKDDHGPVVGEHARVPISWIWRPARTSLNKNTVSPGANRSPLSLIPVQDAGRHDVGFCSNAFPPIDLRRGHRPG